MAMAVLPSALSAQTNHLVISQVYGAGGNSGAAYTHDYVELFNPTAAPVSINGWSLQYAATSGTSWSVNALPNATIQPGQYFLVRLAGGTTGAALPTPDHIVSSSPINMAAANGKIALVSTTTGPGAVACPAAATVVDFVGFGTANCSETAAAPAPSATNAIFRTNNGCTDTDNNSSDFSASSAAPRNSSTPLNVCSTGPSCGITTGTPSTECNSTTAGDTDTYQLSIPYTGSQAGVTVINNSGSGTVGGDDPATVADGTIVISGISETNDYSVTFSSPCQAIVISGNAPACDPVITYDLVINEILADPGAVNGDANGDGAISTSNDEFVEIVNNGAEAVDLSGWTLSDAVSIRHTFPSGSEVAAGCAIVVFGGGTPTGAFGGATAQTASTGQLGLNNGGDDVILQNGTTVIAQHTYGSEGGNDQSITRSPDITGTFVPHTSATNSVGSFSPGRKVDLTSFSGCQAPACGITFGIVVGECNTNTSGTGDTYDLSISYTGVQAGVTVINSSGSGTVGGDDPAVVANGTIVISGISETDNYSVSLSAPCSAVTVSGAAPICEPPPPPPAIVINEVDYDQPGTDTAEFIELTNNGAASVPLNGMQLILINGSNGTTYSTVTLDNVTLAPGEHHVVCYGNNAAPYCDQTVAAAIQNGDPDGIRLTTADATVLDEMSYGGSMSTTEGSSATTDIGSVTGLGLSRIPDGADTDDNSADFVRTCITPGAANTSVDSDGDGVNDCLDICPGGPEPGTLCDDGNANTSDDVVGNDCVCAGVAVDCLGVVGGPALPGTSCDDGDPLTVGDVYQEDCSCAGEQLDCLGVPGGTAVAGSPCDDGDADTFDDTWTANCECVGTPTGPCTENLTIEFQTDADGNQTSWEILSQGTLDLMCDGQGYPSNAVVTDDCCVPAGCYLLRVYDSAGDGITGGGYILRTSGPDGQRIIDNRNNFTTGSVSAISGDQGFCLPIGTDRLIYTSCDKLDWLNNQFLVASANAAVSAEWVPNAPNSAQDPTSGYDFWFFDPNGSYSFVRQRRHDQPDGFGNVGATRTAHMQINNWALANHIPTGVLMNVRVRGVVNGDPMEWGPACRFKIDPVAAACPMTKLMDIPGNQFLSCGQYRQWAPGSKVHARPVSGATAYQFRFRQPAEGYEVVRTVSAYYVQLFWNSSVGAPLVTGSQYEVDVRAFKNGQWCPWGDVCTLNIGSPVNGGGQQQSALIEESATLNMWPNPNRGDQLFLTITAVPAGVTTITADVFDMYGKRVAAETYAVNEGMFNATMDLNGKLAAGMYMVNISIGDVVKTQRLIVHL